jgi:hypothetical protein
MTPGISRLGNIYYSYLIQRSQPLTLGNKLIKDMRKEGRSQRTWRIAQSIVRGTESQQFDLPALEPDRSELASQLCREEGMRGKKALTALVSITIPVK